MSYGAAGPGGGTRNYVKDIKKARPDILDVVMRVDNLADKGLAEKKLESVVGATWSNKYGLNRSIVEAKLNEYYKSYASMTKEAGEQWSAQSKIGLGRGTRLTGGRGVSSRPQVQMSKLKTKLGE
jgi:hypothetical protein